MKRICPKSGDELTAMPRGAYKCTSCGGMFVPRIHLERCGSCHGIWFDVGEW